RSSARTARPRSRLPASWFTFDAPTAGTPPPTDRRGRPCRVVDEPQVGVQKRPTTRHRAVTFGEEIAELEPAVGRRPATPGQGGRHAEEPSRPSLLLASPDPAQRVAVQQTAFAYDV